MMNGIKDGLELIQLMNADSKNVWFLFLSISFNKFQWISSSSEYIL